MSKKDLAYLRPSASDNALTGSISRRKRMSQKRSDRNRAFSILIGLTIPLLLLLVAGFQLEAATHEYGAALQVAAVDLNITKMATPESVAAGEQVTYTVTVRNEGTLTATNVVLSDSLPSGLSTALWSTNVNGATCDDSADPIVCQLGDLEAGASALITLVVDVDPAITGSLINSAEVTSDIGEDDVSNNTATAPLTVFASADLSLAKTAHAGLVLSGTPVTYTLTISNDGPSDAPGVTVIDELPKGTSYISSDGALCSRHARTIECVLASPLQAGTSTIITLVLGINTEVNGPLTNIAEVSSDIPDNSPDNNVGSVTIIVNGQADLSLVKTASSGDVLAGGRLTYTLTVNNAGPSAANNVVISDTLPPGTSFVSSSGASCSEVNNLLDCSIPGAIDASANAVVTVVVGVDSTADGTLTNYAEVSSDAADDPPGNNQDSVLVNVMAKADLSLVKTASSGIVFPGDRLTYTLTVGNAGPSVAGSVVISDTLPPGTSFVSASGASCSEVNNLLDCSIPGVIDASANAVVTVVVDVDSTTDGALTNYAEVSSNAADDPPGNNQDSVLVTVGAMADLSLVKTASSDNVLPGGRLTYTLTVDNAGPSAADNVVISDTLPPGTSFVSASGASCMDVNGLVTCSLPGSIAAGANTAFTLVVNIDSSASGMVINAAEVHSDAADDSMAANLASASTVIDYRVFLPLMLNGNQTGEPNNTCEQAFEILPNKNYYFMPEDTFDWYEFDLTAPGNIIIVLTDFTPNLGQVAAYKSADCANRSAGFLGNMGDPGTTKILDLGQQTPGHYYVFVGSDGPLSDTLPYRLLILV